MTEVKYEIQKERFEGRTIESANNREQAKSVAEAGGGPNCIPFGVKDAEMQGYTESHIEKWIKCKLNQGARREGKLLPHLLLVLS